MPTQRQAIAWIDAGGRTRQTIFLASTTGSTLRAALLNHSNADVQDWFEGPDNFNLTPTPTNAAYPNVSDAARLIFADGSGNQASITLPAPQAAIFLADLTTVDPSAIADIITAATTYLVNSAGNIVTTYLAGVRTTATSAG